MKPLRNSDLTSVLVDEFRGEGILFEFTSVPLSILFRCVLVADDLSSLVILVDEFELFFRFSSDEEEDMRLLERGVVLFGDDLR